MEGKLSKNFISEVCNTHTIKLVALPINRYTRSSSQFQKVGNPCTKRTLSGVATSGDG